MWQVSWTSARVSTQLRHPIACNVDPINVLKEPNKVWATAPVPPCTGQHVSAGDLLLPVGAAVPGAPAAAGGAQPRQPLPAGAGVHAAAAPH